MANTRVSAQDDVWTAVRNVPEGSRVRVTLRENGANITGTLVELREDAIVMNDNAADRAFLFPSGSRLRDAVRSTHMRRTLIGILVILVLMTGAFPTQYASAQDDLWAALRNLPAGSRVRVTLREDGTNVTGTLVELRQEAVVMTENAADRAHAFRFASGTSLRDAAPFARAELTRATLVDIVLPYRSDPPHAAVARRVLSEFADGRFKPRLTVKYGTKTVRGTIADVGADDFAVRRKGNDVVRVRYSELVSVSKPAINQAGWMAIGGAAGGLGAWAFCAALHCNQ